MAQGLMGKARELAGCWGVTGVWGEWGEIALGPVPVGIVCVLAVGQKFLIRQAFHAMM